MDYHDNTPEGLVSTIFCIKFAVFVGILQRRLLIFINNAEILIYSCKALRIRCSSWCSVPPLPRFSAAHGARNRNAGSGTRQSALLQPRSKGWSLKWSRVEYPATPAAVPWIWPRLYRYKTPISSIAADTLFLSPHTPFSPYIQQELSDLYLYYIVYHFLAGNSRFQNLKFLLTKGGSIVIITKLWNARVLEQVDRHVWGACGNSRGSSILLSRTTK